MVGYTAGNGGKVRVGGWEEVERDMGGENLLRERGGEESREAGLEDSECWGEEYVSGLRNIGAYTGEKKQIEMVD